MNSVKSVSSFRRGGGGCGFLARLGARLRPPVLAGIAVVLAGAAAVRGDGVVGAGDVDIRPRRIGAVQLSGGENLVPPTKITNYNGIAYLYQSALWRTNGRAAGTWRVAGTEGSTVEPVLIEASGRWLIFQGNTLKAYDTASGSLSVLSGRARSPGYSGVPIVNGRALFLSIDSRPVLWATDGTQAGTTAVTPPGVGVTDVAGLGSFGVMIAASTDWPPELWRTDGTVEGTRLITPLSRLPWWSDYSSRLRCVEEGVVFQFRGGILPNMNEVWFSDGTTEGTRLITQIPHLGPTSEPLPNNGATSFIGVVESDQSDPTGKRVVDLWRVSSNPDAGGRVVRLGPTWLFPVGTYGGFSLFIDWPGVLSPSTMWLSDGSGERTFKLPGFPGMAVWSMTEFSHVIGDKVYFSSATGGNGFEPWCFDLSTFEFRNLRDIRPGRDSSSPKKFFPLGHNKGVGFLALSPIPGSSAVFVSDGTPRGTRMISRTEGWAFAALGNRILFSGANNLGGLNVIDLCPADYDNSGSVDVTDLFAFIADWMSRDGNADFDNSGGVPGIADLSGYLSSWMNGCN